MNRNQERENNIGGGGVQNIDQFDFNNICLPLAAQKREFECYIEDKLKTYIESGELQNTFEWAQVKKFYNYSKTKLTDLWALRMFCSFVLKLLFKFNCEDHKFMITIIYLYHRMLIEYKTIYRCENCAHLLPEHYEYEELKEAHCILKSINKAMDNTYRFTNREFYSDLTVDAIDGSDYVFLQFLTKYGLNYFPDDEAYSVIKSEIHELFLRYRFLKRILEICGEANEVLNVLERLFTDKENPNLKRIYLTVKAVNITLRMRMYMIDQNAGKYYTDRDHVQCLNFYASTFPEAAISAKEVEDFLELALPDYIVFTSETCSTFREVFPKNPCLPSPRALKHLCRCKVRDCIKKSPSLTVILSDLQIPDGVKDYLLFLSN